MVANKDTGTKLISDIVFFTQRASANTCDVAARTIERMALRHLKFYPGDIKNASAYQDIADKLCQSVQELAHVAIGTGEEILAKRRALDLLLALSNEIEYLPNYNIDEQRETDIDLACTA